MDDEPFDEAADGSSEPPPPGMMFAPARNAADFDDLPPGFEKAAAESRKHADEPRAEAESPPEHDAP